jgi:kinesin family protein 11
MSDDCFSPVTQRILSSRAKAGAAAGTTEIRPVTQSTSAAATGSQDDKGSNVQVVVRCRPPTDSEKRIGDIVLACVNQSEVKINANLKGKALNKMYTFDQSYGQLATQEEVYHNAVKPLVDEVLNGFNCKRTEQPRNKQTAVI